jgi:uncharacterized membrane protein
VTVTITEQRVNHLIRYQTCGPALVRGGWEAAFAADPDAGGTRVREQLVVPLGAPGRAMLALIGKLPDREVAANLTLLKQLLETGQGSGTTADRTLPAAQPVRLSDEERGARR